jgi:hypothetical protein
LQLPYRHVTTRPVSMVGSGLRETGRRYLPGRGQESARPVIRRIVFRPAAVRDLARLDRVVRHGSTPPWWDSPQVAGLFQP